MATSTIATGDSMAAGTLVANFPRGITLAIDEHVVQAASFRFSIAHFFLSSRLVLTSKHLVGDRPNALFGLMTMGSETFSCSLLNLASARTRTEIRVLPLIIGLSMAAVGTSNLASYWPALLVGTFFCLAAFQAVLRVANRDGGFVDVKLSLSDKGKAQAFADRINATIAQTSPGHPGSCSNSLTRALARQEAGARRAKQPVVS
jgi:hypothetical protein